MSAAVQNGNYFDPIGMHAVVNNIRKALHLAAAHITLSDAVNLGKDLDSREQLIDSRSEFIA
jgi:hypothetical protein